MVIKAYKAYKAGGFSEVLKKTISKFYTRYYLYLIKLEPEIINQIRKYPQFNFVALDNELLQKMYKEFPQEITPGKYNVLKDRIRDESTDKCYVILDAEQNIYGFYSISFGDNVDIDAKFTVAANNEDIHLFDAYTFISRRGKKAQHFALASRLKIAYDMGYKYANTIVMDGNSASEKSILDSGFRKSKIVEYYHILGFKKTVIKDI